MLKQYRIAGLTVAMDTFGRAEKQAEAYRAEFAEAPQISLSVDSETLRKMYPYLTRDDAEYIFICSQFYEKMLDFGGMMLHASAVVKDGYAFLFSAPSGTGKSTHTGLWQKVFGADRALILNDDKPALRLENGRWYAYGTPWSGKSDLNLNMKVPLGGICLLERGEDNKIMPFGGARAAFAVLDQTLRPNSAESRTKVLDLLSDLLEKVPVWKLQCTPTEAAVKVSHDAMYQAAKERWPE